MWREGDHNPILAHKHNLQVTSRFKGESVLFVCICGGYLWVKLALPFLKDEVGL